MTEPLKFKSDEEKKLWVQAYAAAQAHGSLHCADRIADNAIRACRLREQDDIDARLGDLMQVVTTEAECVDDWAKVLDAKPSEHLALVAMRLRVALDKATA